VLDHSSTASARVCGVHDGQDAGTAASVRRVFARVDLQSTALAELERRAAGGSDELRAQLISDDPESLSVHVSLSAEDSDGRRGIWHRWHGPSLPDEREEADRLVRFEHRVDLHDIEDAINQMLGRDPTLHRPPRLSSGKLIDALDEAGVSVTERDLIETPLTVELAPEVQAELDRL
jgi:hypothetical protein